MDGIGRLHEEVAPAKKAVFSPAAEHGEGECLANVINVFIEKDPKTQRLMLGMSIPVRWATNASATAYRVI